MAPHRTTLVTGGAGFVGSHLVERLVARGDRVVVLDDLSNGDPAHLSVASSQGAVELRVGSVLDDALVAELVESADEIHHLASPVGVARVLDDPAATISTIVVGAQNVIRHAARLRRPTLVASSSEVYGPRAEGPLREDDRLLSGPPTLARWSYGVAKLASEHLALAAAAAGAPVVVARLFNVVGPRQSAARGMVLPRLVSQALAGEPLTVHGDGEQARCFCDARDVARALAALLATPRAHGRVVNVGWPAPITISALAALVLESLGVTGAVVRVPYASVYPAGFEDVRTRVPDVSLLRELIAFEPEISLDHTIRDVLDELRREPREARAGAW